ncbi:hypothetical protein ACFV9E_11950 [Streptomyces sp. NPDC059835]
MRHDPQREDVRAIPTTPWPRTHQPADHDDTVRIPRRPRTDRNGNH